MSSASHVLRTTVAAFALLSMQSPKALEVAFCTDAGNFTIELNAAHAPLHVESFLRYVDDGHYSGTIFHRVIEGFMVQGGGYDALFAERSTADAIENESVNGLSNTRGSVAAARTADPDSATAQFYINVVDNPRLDGRAGSPGYTVFGRVTDGMDSVDAIAARPTGPGGPFPTDVPAPIVTILSAARLEHSALAELPDDERDLVLRRRAIDALSAGDYDAALDWTSHYRSTCAPLDAELLVTEASAAAESARTARARYALEQYFASTTAADAHYEEAIELYAKVSPGKHPAALAQFARCQAPAVPGVPNGSVEDLDGMMQGQAVIQAFMRQSSTYLECLDQIISDDKNETQHRQSALVEYNRVVDVTQDLGNRFNEQVRAFRARQ